MLKFPLSYNFQKKAFRLKQNKFLQKNLMPIAHKAFRPSLLFAGKTFDRVQLAAGSKSSLTPTNLKIKKRYCSVRFPNQTQKYKSEFCIIKYKPKIGSLSAKKKNQYHFSLSKHLNLRDKTEVLSFEITLSPIIYQTKCKKYTTVSKK